MHWEAKLRRQVKCQFSLLLLLGISVGMFGQAPSNQQTQGPNYSEKSNAGSDDTGPIPDFSVKGYHLGMSPEDVAEHFKRNPAKWDAAKWVKKNCVSKGRVIDYCYTTDAKETLGNAAVIQAWYEFKDNQMFSMTVDIMREQYSTLAAALEEKFGHSQVGQDSYQNGFGAVLGSQHLEWRRGDAALTLDEMAKSMLGKGELGSDLMQRTSEMKLVNIPIAISVENPAAKPDL